MKWKLLHQTHPECQVHGHCILLGSHGYPEAEPPDLDHRIGPGHRRGNSERGDPEVVLEHHGEPEDLQLSTAWIAGR